MLYFDEQWTPMLKKITYTKEIIVYDNDDSPYLNNPKFQNVVIEDLILTDEQKVRLEKIKMVDIAGLEAIERYVMDGTLADASQAMIEKIKEEDTRDKFTRFIRWDELSTEEMADLIDDFKEYEVGAFYVEGNIFNYNGQLYRVLPSDTGTGHTSQSDWVPSTTPTLYIPIAPPNVIAEWIQPYGGSGTYVLGEQVLYKGSIYENIYKSKTYNVWSPEGLPTGWKKIK